MKKTLLMAVFLLATACAGKFEAQALKGTAALTVVTAYTHTYDFLESEEGTYQVCRDIIDKYKAEAENCLEGDPCQVDIENRAMEDCQNKLRETEKNFDTALSSLAMSVEIFELCLDAKDWKSADAINAMKNIYESLVNIIDLMKMMGVDIPKQLDEALKFIDGYIGSRGES